MCPVVVGGGSGIRVDSVSFRDHPRVSQLWPPVFARKGSLKRMGKVQLEESWDKNVSFGLIRRPYLLVRTPERTGLGILGQMLCTYHLPFGEEYACVLFALVGVLQGA